MIEEQLKKLKLEEETLSGEIEVKKARLIEVRKIIKETEKHLEKAKLSLNGAS